MASLLKFQATELALAVFAVPAAAKPRTAAENPVALQKVLDCRALPDSQARLACYDTSIAQLDTARSRGDIAVVDRQQVRETRTKLFGFALPHFAIFGDKDDESGTPAERQGVEEISGKARSATRGVDGWVITLEDGARWEQTGVMTFGRNPKPGSVIVIKRAALGSFKLSIDGGPAVKARRIG